jgi:hypothetical protein
MATTTAKIKKSKTKLQKPKAMTSVRPLDVHHYPIDLKKDFSTS